MIEYPTLSEAKAAVQGANGTKLLDQTLGVDYAFVRPPPAKGGKAGNTTNANKDSGRIGNKPRSRSPEAKQKDTQEEQQ